MDRPAPQTSPNAPSLSAAALVTIPEARSEALSADGSQLASIETTSGLPQIWMRPMAGGAARQVTDFEERIVQIAFAPQGGDLLFTTDCGMDERFQLWLLPEDGTGGHGPARPLTRAPGVVHNWGAWSPGADHIAFSDNSRDPRIMDIHVMEIATGARRCVNKGAGFQEVLCFTKDGSALILRDAAKGNNDQRLLRLELESGAVEPLLEPAGRVRFVQVRPRKDGSGLWLLCDRGREFHAIFTLDFHSGALKEVLAFDGSDIDSFALDSTQSTLAAVVNEGGFSRLVMAEAGDVTGTLSTLPLPLPGVVQSLRFTPEGALLATLEATGAAPDIWQIDPATGTATNLTRPALLAAKPDQPRPDPAQRPALESFASFDGGEIAYCLYAPEGERPATGWPVLFLVHGGPESQWKPGWRADLLHYTSAGIMVVAPNVRGSTGYGRTFHESDDVEKRMDSVADLIALGRRIAAREDVDAARIGVMGQSYGGFMVLAALAGAPDLWRTGVDLYGVANFTTLMETTGPWRRQLRAAEYGCPDTQAGFLASISPVHTLDRICAPLMIVHATDDPRVPMEQGEQVMARLRGRGHPVEMLRIDHEGHGFSRLSNRARVFSRIADWLQRTL